MKPALDGADGLARLRGDPVDGLPIQVEERQGTRVGGGDAAQGRLDVQAEHKRFFLGHAEVDPVQVRERQGVAAPPRESPRLVARDAVGPRPQALRIPQRADRLADAEKGGGGGVLSVLELAQLGVGDAEEPCAQALDQFGQCVAVAVAGAEDQIILVMFWLHHCARPWRWGNG